MKKAIIFVSVVIMFTALQKNFVIADQITNGSFEADGLVSDITDPCTRPTAWDVNVPTAQFAGLIGDEYGVTDGNYSLTLYSKKFSTFFVNDIAFISQMVDLSDVNRINFDVQLSTSSGVWNPALRSVVVMIDDQVVWESGKTGPDISGQYNNQVINVSVSDRRLREFAIGLRADANEMSGIYYYTDWDGIGFDLVCDGNGLLDGDFNRDCSVDINDYCVLADLWMGEVELYSVYNISHVQDVNTQGIINFCDYDAWAQDWDPNDPNSIIELQEFKSVWLTEVPVDSQWNLYKDDGIPRHGIVNADDLAIFVRDWLESSLE